MIEIIQPIYFVLSLFIIFSVWYVSGEILLRFKPKEERRRR